MVLTNAQYEGEPCLQVLVRTSDQGQQPAAPVAASATEEIELGLPGFIRAAETLFNSSSQNCFTLFVNLDHFATTQQSYGLIGSETVTKACIHTLVRNG